MAVMTTPSKRLGRPILAGLWAKHRTAVTTVAWMTVVAIGIGCDSSAKSPARPTDTTTAPAAKTDSSISAPQSPSATGRKESRPADTTPSKTPTESATPSAPPTRTDNADDSQLPDLVRERMKAARERLAAAPNNCDAAIQVGILCLANNRLDEALAAFNRATQMMPKNPRGWYYLALTEIAQGHRDKAIIALENTKALDNAIAAVHFRLGDYARDVGEFGKAIEHYLRAADLDPASDEPSLRIGECQRSLKNEEDASAAFRRAVAINPRSGPANAALAELLKAQGKDDEAAEFERIASRNYPTTPVSDPWGMDLIDLGRPDEAIERRKREILARTNVLPCLRYLEGVLKESPDHVGALSALAACYAELGSAQSAERCYRRLEQLKPGDIQVKADFATALIRIGRTEEAEIIVREVLRKNPDNPQILARLGEIQATRKKYSEALSTLTRAASLAPTDPTIECALADLCDLTKKTDEIMPHIDAALKINPKFAPALHRRGVRRAAEGDDAGARNDWLAAIAADPNQPVSYISLAEFSCRVKDFGLYNRIAVEGLRNMPDSAVILNLVAWLRATAPEAEYRNGAEAVKLAERAQQMSQPIPDLYDTLGAAQAEAGQFEAAISSIRTAISMAEKAGQSEKAVQFRDREKLYIEHKPYRMPG